MPTLRKVQAAIQQGQLNYEHYQYQQNSLTAFRRFHAWPEPTLQRVQDYLDSLEPQENHPRLALTTAHAFELTQLLQADIFNVQADCEKHQADHPDLYDLNHDDTDDFWPDINNCLQDCFTRSAAKNVHDELQQCLAFHLWRALLEAFDLIIPKTTLTDAELGEALQYEQHRRLGPIPSDEIIARVNRNERRDAMQAEDLAQWLYELHKNDRLVMITEHSFTSAGHLYQAISQAYRPTASLLTFTPITTPPVSRLNRSMPALTQANNAPSPVLPYPTSPYQRRAHLHSLTNA